MDLMRRCLAAVTSPLASPAPAPLLLDSTRQARQHNILTP